MIDATWAAGGALATKTDQYSVRAPAYTSPGLRGRPDSWASGEGRKACCLVSRRRSQDRLTMAYRPRRTRPRHALNGAAAAPARRTCCWRTAKIATVMLAMCEWRSSQAAQRTLMDITDHVEAEDLELSGNCGGGCVRQVVDAVAPALGEIDCELRVENLLDHTDQDVAGGSLNVVHSCSDADGNLLYQVRLVRGRERDQRGHSSSIPMVEPTTFLKLCFWIE